MKPSVLLINPWIYDFAAFDLWARPLGLLYLAAWLEKAGAKVRLLDCLDRLQPDSGAPPRRKNWENGTGQWARTIVPTPGPLAEIPRRYCRYGLPEDAFRRQAETGPRPDLILVTSSMTYWYPGVHRAIALVRGIWPDTPVLLGGTYATLCRDHAVSHAGADIVVSGPGELFLRQAATHLPGADFSACPDGLLDLRPNLDLYPALDFAPLMTSRGCPLKCPYCASRLVYNGFSPRSPEDVLAEIEDRHQRLGVSDFAFFDDALLVDARRRLIPILEGVIRRGFKIRFHVPNGLHVSLIDQDLARLMHAAGFRTMRLGVESLDIERQHRLGDKVEPGQFEQAVQNLIRAGFDPVRIGGYILYGLPNQDLNEVLSTADAVRAAGARPYLAEFSPLPGTNLWQEALDASPFDLANEPLYHNNTFFPCRGADFSWERAWDIKRRALGR